MSKSVIKASRKEWAAWALWSRGVTVARIAKDMEVTDRCIYRWFNRCKREIEQVPGFDAAESYLQGLAKPSMQLLREEIARGNWRVALKVLEGTGLLNPNGADGDFGAMTDDNLITEIIELAIESGDKTLRAKVQRVRIPAGALGSSFQEQDTEALDGAETPEA